MKELTEKYLNKLVCYAKGLKAWENIIDEDETDGYKITEDGRLVVIHEEDADHYTAKWSIDGITEGLCGLTALERKIERILLYFYSSATAERVREIATRKKEV